MKGEPFPGSAVPGSVAAGSRVASRRTPSLRRRLLLLLLSSIAVLWVGTAALSFTAARHEIDELFDAQLAQSAQVIMTQAQQQVGQMATEVEEFQHRYEQKLAFQIWDSQGALLLRTTNAPKVRMSDSDTGFSDTVINGEVFRVFSRWERGGRFLIQVGQSEEIRDELASDIVLILLSPVLFGFPVLALLIWASVGRGLAPLDQAARELEDRAPGNLSPIGARGTPAEIQPLIAALNDLFLRLQQAFESERRFTADAAHELRTPLAALKTHCQVALRASNDPERRKALNHLMSGVERATQLVQQLLTLARVDPDAAQDAQHLDLRALAEKVLSELGPDAVERQVELTLDEGPSPQIAGDPTTLAVLLRNLVDNAVRYTPSGGAVTVRAHRLDGAPVLEVEDTGPGIPPDQRSRVFERFYRIAGSDEPGSGLGLSIVKRIAELHRAEVRLEEGAGGQGLRARVIFPATSVS